MDIDIEKVAQKLGYSVEDAEHWLTCDKCYSGYEGPELCFDAPSMLRYREQRKNEPPSATELMIRDIYGPIIKQQLEGSSWIKKFAEEDT